MGKVIKNYKLITYLLCNALFIFLLVVVGLTDATSDDYGSQMILFSEAGSLCPWSSIVWSVPLYWLQNVLPIFAWQYFAQVIIIVISLNIFIRMILDRFDESLGIASAILFTVISFQCLICKFNFTQTSAFGMAAGVILIFEICFEKTNIKKILCLVGGMLLIVFSNQIRPSILYIFVGCVALLLIYAITFRTRSLKNEIICLVISVLICISLVGADSYVKENDEDFSKLMDYVDALTCVVDYDIASYDDAAEVYTELGLSENDVEMIQRKCESDPDFYNLDLLSELGEKVSSQASFNYFKDNLPKYLKRSIKLLLINWLQYFCYVIIVLAFFSLDGKKKLLPLGSVVMIIAYVLLFAFLGRLVERVIAGVVLLATVPDLILMSQISIKTSQKRKTLAAIVCVAFLFTVVIYMTEKRDLIADENEMQLANEISEDTTHFYAYSTIIDQNYKYTQNLLLTKYYSMEDNSYYLNMTATAPYEQVKFNKYGIKNVYADSVDSPIIRFVLKDDVELVQKYIREHYCKNAEIVSDITLGENYIYKVISTDE